MKDQQIATLEAALNRRGTKLSVELANVGNPDYRQNPDRPLPETTCGWAQVDTLAEASALCRLYIHFYDLGGGNWSGGKITQNDAIIARVAYNGRVFKSKDGQLTLKAECLYEPQH